ncbi:MAG: hypothetical protein AAFX79_13090 [Planctomycetota bacterium]
MQRMAGAVAVLLGSGTLAQSAVLIEIDDPVLEPGVSTGVLLSAAFPATDYAMCCILTDLLASSDAGTWSDLEVVAPMDGPGASAGAVTPAGIEGILGGQLNFPPAGSGPSPDNPIAFWRGTYTAPDDVAAPLDLDLITQTTRFEVYIADGDPTPVSRLDGLVEASATIRVVPAPGAGLLLAGLLLGGGRRRRA